MEDQPRGVLNPLDFRPRNKITFAELHTRGKRLECPNCHVQVIPHLGSWIKEFFHCDSCNAKLCFRNTSARAAICPCNCSSTSILQHNLTLLVCGGCESKVIYRRTDRAVKCFHCKHVTIPPVRNYGVRPVNPQAVQIVFPQVKGCVPPPQAVRVPPPQANRVVPPQANRAVPPQANRVILPQVNRVVPPRVFQSRNRVATAESESTASSPTVRNVATEREVEQYRREKAAGKRILRE